MTTVKFLSGLQALICLVATVVLSICYIEESVITFLIIVFEVAAVINVANYKDIKFK